ncbi:MAG: response regulator [Flavobacteriales bacterium]|nr:response regulator [Flavobacteriales bacterium]
MEKSKVFIVEDDPFYREMVVNELSKDKSLVLESFDNGTDFKNNLYKNPDVVLMDYGLEDSDGLALLREIKGLNPNIEVIFLSAQEKLQVAINSLKYGAFDYITKNDAALSRLLPTINRIFTIKNALLTQKQFKRFKIGAIVFFAVLISLLAAIEVVKPELL